MIASGPSDIDPHVAPLSPTQSFQRLHECGDRGGLVCFDLPPHEHADVPHAGRFLRSRGQRPSNPTPPPREELAAPPSVTPSARARSARGMAIRTPPTD